MEAKGVLVRLNYQPILMSELLANVIKLGCLNDGLLKRGQFSFLNSQKLYAHHLGTFHCQPVTHALHSISLVFTPNLKTAYDSLTTKADSSLRQQGAGATHIWGASSKELIQEFRLPSSSLCASVPVENTDLCFCREKQKIVHSKNRILRLSTKRGVMFSNTQHIETA